MLGCSEPGSRVIISCADNPARKYAWTLEMVRGPVCWIGVHTGRTNQVVHEGLERGLIDAFGRISSIRREVTLGRHVRLDFLLHTGTGRVYLEVKQCSLAENGIGLFPDAVTVRGAKHMRELIPATKVTFVAGEEMKEKISEYLRILPSKIGRASCRERV